MGKYLRIDLTDVQRRELHELLARNDLSAYTRQRAGCIPFLDRGKTTAESPTCWNANRSRSGPRSTALRRAGSQGCPMLRASGPPPWTG